MKNLNFKIIILCFSLSILVLNCNISSEIIPFVDSDPYNSLDALVQTLKPKTQTFTIDPTVSQVVTGADGTIINIAPNTFTDNNNNLITNSITVKLREHLTLADMLLANAQTSSNGQLLVTGGSFKLTFEDEDGNAVNSNPDNINSQILVRTNIINYQNEMQYFTGDSTIVDGREIVNWELYQEAPPMQDGIFVFYGIKQGLSNCDVLFNMAGEMPTQFEVSVSEVTDYSNTNVWMVIEDFPSIIVLTQLNTDMTALKSYDNSIPTGLNATLIAITIDNDNYLKFGTLPITVLGDDTFNIEVDYGTTAELTTIINSITN